MAAILVYIAALKGFSLKRLAGEPPIPRYCFTLGKSALLAIWALSALAASGLDIGPWWTNPGGGIETAGWILTMIGLVLANVSLLNLGRATSMGLPSKNGESATQKGPGLQTTGLYHLSRNPMYVGFYLICLGTCLTVPRPVVWFCAALAILIHDRIVRAEEDYLKRRFAAQWEDYRKKTRRYF